jgi:hypothetical protein
MANVRGYGRVRAVSTATMHTVERTIEDRVEAKLTEQHAVTGSSARYRTGDDPRPARTDLGGWTDDHSGGACPGAGDRTSS